MRKFNKMPKEATLAGIGYRIIEQDGLICFVNDQNISGHVRKIVFKYNADLWSVLTLDNLGKNYAPVCHVLDAYELVKKIYGDDFEGGVK